MQSVEWPPCLPPSRTLAVPSLLLLLLAAPAPAAASPDGPEPCFVMSMFMQKIASGGYSGQANAVFRMAFNRNTFHLQP